jgi:hypothetical protein
LSKLSITAIVAILLNLFQCSFATAAVEKTAQDWQIRSLKGITSIKYAVGYDPEKKVAKQVADGLSALKVPMTSVTLKEEKVNSLSTSEALLIVSVDRRGKDKKWVGLYVQQKAKLDRDPSIACEAETYKIGSVCAKDAVDDTIKELCGQFVADFSKK